MTETASDTRACPRCAETIKSAAKVCRFCGAEFESDAVVTGRAPGAPRGGKSPVLGCVGAAVFVLVAVVWIFVSAGSSARHANDLVREARNHPDPSGSHCLDPSLGHIDADLWLTVKRSLDDPDSMRDMQMVITPVNNGGTHMIRFDFRASNAFGAIVRRAVVAEVAAQGCKLLNWRFVS